MLGDTGDEGVCGTLGCNNNAWDACAIDRVGDALGYDDAMDVYAGGRGTHNLGGYGGGVDEDSPPLPCTVWEDHPLTYIAWGGITPRTGEDHPLARTNRVTDGGRLRQGP
jgi:hypothetical protein